MNIGWIDLYRKGKIAAAIVTLGVSEWDDSQRSLDWHTNWDKDFSEMYDCFTNAYAKKEHENESAN